jgi:hypothetical protein
MLEVVDELERNGQSCSIFRASWRAICAICWWRDFREAIRADRGQPGRAREMARHRGAFPKRI